MEPVLHKDTNKFKIVNIGNLQLVPSEGRKVTPQSECIKDLLLSIPAGQATSLNTVVATVTGKVGGERTDVYQKVQLALRRKWARHLQKMKEQETQNLYILNTTPAGNNEQVTTEYAVQ